MLLKKKKKKKIKRFLSQGVVNQGGGVQTGEGGTFGGLAEKLADLLVHVAQEVHV